MTIPQPNNILTQNAGLSPQNISIPHYDTRSPAATDVIYPLGKTWLDHQNITIWQLASFTSTQGTLAANWVQLYPTDGGTGDFTTLNVSGNADIGGALVVDGNITSTAGDITATDGNLVLGTAGNKLVIDDGANGSVGTSAAMVAGSVTVATTAYVAATSKIYFSRLTAGGTLGNASIVNAGSDGSFDILSDSNTETSTFNWWIIN